MTLLDVLLILIVLTAVVAAVRYMVRHKGKGCHGHCAGCRSKCCHCKE